MPDLEASQLRGKRVSLGVSNLLEVSVDAVAPSAGGGELDELKRHLARELHDLVAQPLIELVIEMSRVRASLDDPGPLAAELDRLEESARQVLRQTRETMIDLRERGDLRTNLGDALRQDLVAPPGRTLSVRVSSRWPQRTNGWAGFNLMRIVQQAVANAWRHGRAQKVEVILDVSPSDDAVVVVLDDGIGVDGAPAGFGLLGMAERAIILGGQLTTGSRHGGGTRVEARVPVDRLA